jgi:hypothetical protein
MAFTALLMASYRQSKRRTGEFLTTLLGQPCCAALTVKIQARVTASARPAYEELAAKLPTEEHINADETATKAPNGTAWLWTFVAWMFTVFAVRAGREATAVDQLLTAAFGGIVTCDRATMYWRAGVAARSHLAQAFLRNAKHGRQPLCGNHAHRDRKLPPTASQRLRPSPGHRPGPSHWPTRPLTPRRGVNG